MMKEKENETRCQELLGRKMDGRHRLQFLKKHLTGPDVILVVAADNNRSFKDSHH